MEDLMIKQIGPEVERMFAIKRQWPDEVDYYGSNVGWFKTRRNAEKRIKQLKGYWDYRGMVSCEVVPIVTYEVIEDET